MLQIVSVGIKNTGCGNQKRQRQPIRFRIVCPEEEGDEAEVKTGAGEFVWRVTKIKYQK